MPKRKVPEDKIRETAYRMWQDDGAPEGKDQEYWFRAEAALTAPPPRKKAPAKPRKAAKPKA